MVLAVLSMVELVGVGEGVHDGLKDRFQKEGVDIYTKSIHKKFHEASLKITTLCRPPVRVSSKRLSVPPPLFLNSQYHVPVGTINIFLSYFCIHLDKGKCHQA